MYDSINDETASLINGGDDDDDHDHYRKKETATSSPSSGSSSSTSNLMINRIMIILLLAGLVTISICLQSFRTNILDRVSIDEEKIHNLEKTIKSQETIIERFNESITNSDVIKKLNSMEKEWNDEHVDILNQLSQTRKDVSKQLNTTMISLNETVVAAELEIHEQVNTVKKDFDQYVIHTEDQFSMENTFMVYQLAGTFTLLSCLISMWHMGSHIRKMQQPAIQRKILAILWMCPIYAVTSWLSLVFPQCAGYLAIIKDGYEAYIIYQFLSFCIAVLGGGDRQKVIDHLSKRVDHLTPPFRLCPCCCKPDYEDERVLADAILTQCQAFTMQFVFWRPVTTIANFLLNQYEYYGPWTDNPRDYKAPQFYITLIQNLSIFIAFAGLLKFYHAVDKDLEWCRPFAKFLCIKGVVFMTFWQGLALTILAESTDFGSDDSDAWAESAQNFLICLEMLLFSIAHFYCFPVEEWQPGYQANYEKAKFGETLALNDFFTDLKLVMSSNHGYKKKKKHRVSDTTVPEGNEEDSTVDETAQNSENLTEKSSNEGMEGNDDGGGDDDENNDEEDPKQALVQAIANTVKECESDSNEPDVEEAQRRIGSMLDDMLFQSPPRDYAETKNDKNSQEPKQALSDSKRNLEDEWEDIENLTERTGLLSWENTASMEQNLRPSIFTTIAEHMDRDQSEKKNQDTGEESKVE